MIFTTLIEPRELHAFMLNQKVSGNRNIIILDCSCSIADPELGIKLYAKEHIPGAVLVDFDRYVTGKVAQGTGRHPMPDRETFRQSMKYFGIRPDRQVVLYDQGGLGFATRFWYELRWLGLENVCVLDGGMTAWKEENLPVTDKPTEPLKDGKIPELEPLEVPVPMETVQDNLKTKEYLEVDARPALRFQGIGETIDHKAGHIPGAVNRPGSENFLPDGRFKPAPVLREEFLKLLDGRAPDKVINSCGSGVNASANLLAELKRSFLDPALKQINEKTPLLAKYSIDDSGKFLFSIIDKQNPV